MKGGDIVKSRKFQLTAAGRVQSVIRRPGRRSSSLNSPFNFELVVLNRRSLPDSQRIAAFIMSGTVLAQDVPVAKDVPVARMSCWCMVYMRRIVLDRCHSLPAARGFAGNSGGRIR